MRIFSQDLFFAMLNSGSQRVTVTINPYLIDQVDKSLPDPTVTVTLSAEGEATVTGTGPQSITVNAGTDVFYKVEKTDYTTQDNQRITPYSNISKNVTLSNIETRTVTINRTPNDANIKITCVETGNVTYAATAQVELGYSYVVELTRADLTTTTVSFICSAEAEENVHDVIMDATISWGSVLPNGSTKTMSLDYTFQNPYIDDSFIKVPCTTQIVYWKVEKPGYTTATGTEEQDSQTNILTNRTISAVNLSPALLHYTLSVYPTTALIEGSVYNPSTGITTQFSGQGPEYGIECYMGDQISYTVSAEGYDSVSGTVSEMGSTDAGISVTLSRSTSLVTITAVPSMAIVSLSIDGGNPIVGTGYVTYNVPVGSVITYSATYEQSTTVPETYTIASTSPFSDTVYLTPTTDVRLLESSQDIHLTKGVWRFLLVGAGAGGYSGSSRATSGRTTAGGSHGCGGGGSGRITLVDVTISEEEGRTIPCTVGAGGVDKQDGENTSIGNILINGRIYGYLAPGGYTGRVTGGGVEESVYKYYGGTGGCGGGAGGVAGYVTGGGGTVSRQQTSGGKGGMGAGDGETKSSYLYTTTPATLTEHLGGSGFGGGTASYDNNNGTSISTFTFGNPGKKGKGLSSISSLLLDPDYFSSLSSTSDLYNSMSGGGGGGPSGIPPVNATIGNVFGGPGGGGGGWEDGEDGVNGASGYGGKGGDGAILYMRLSWS